MSFAAVGESGRVDEVRISVLSLLKPQRISLESKTEVAVTVETGGHQSSIRLHPGEQISVFQRNKVLEAEIISESETRSYSDVDSIDVDCLSDVGTLFVAVEEPSPFRREFHGKISVSQNGNSLLIVLTAPLEQVVGEITAAEMGSGAEGQAMMAQAVAVRSYILAARTNHANDDFDLCDTSHCLLYRGLEGAFGEGSRETLARAILAAKQTAGMVLVYGGKVVPGYFQPCCGGVSATPAMIWGTDATGGAFVQVACEFCRESPYFRWQREASLARIVQILTNRTAETKGWTLRVEHYADSPFVSRVILEKESRLYTVFSPDDFKLKIGRALGWDMVRSNAWSISIEGDTAVFSGRGFGHGVGLCQEGAKAAAAKGWDWRQILKFYYPRCSIQLRQ